MEDLFKFIVQGMINYHKCNSFDENSGEELLHSLQKEHNFEHNIDIPIGLIGILKIFSDDAESQYYCRSTKEEIYRFLENIDEEILIHSFKEGIGSLFISIKSYFNVKKMILEFTKVFYNENFKNSFFRSSLYTKTAEEILMNLYRLIAIILSNKTNKEYRN